MVKLPEDMIIEILSILPVKSLIRFRCVSKSWYALVKSSSFISKHLKKDHNIHLIVEHWEKVDNRLEPYLWTWTLIYLGLGLGSHNSSGLQMVWA
ncbi:hypothetical protein ACOSP7_013630 [Xanthoceras sorbifolium]